MLVLSRKENERVMIGKDVAVTVLRIRGGGVRLGIEAPRSVPVHREEVVLRDAAESGQHAGDVVADDAQESE